MQRVGMNLVRAKAAAISLLTRVRGSPGSGLTPLGTEKAASIIERLFSFLHDRLILSQRRGGAENGGEKSIR
jgi:hypothetical protein